MPGGAGEEIVNQGQGPPLGKGDDRVVRSGRPGRIQGPANDLEGAAHAAQIQRKFQWPAAIQDVLLCNVRAVRFVFLAIASLSSWALRIDQLSFEYYQDKDDEYGQAEG